MEPYIQIKGITKRFGDKTVLNSINLEIHQGEIFGIIGMSGSGKTTLLNTLVGFLEPEKGTITFNTEDKKELLKEKKHFFSRHSKHKEDKNKLLGFATQAASFYPKLTVQENLDLFGSLYGLSDSQRKSNISRLLRLTELSDAAGTLAQNLSGGMEKKLSVACSLIHNPKIIFLDEPTADLDPLSRKEIWHLITEINKLGTTVVVASHFLTELESYCNRLGVLHNKEIIAVGTPDELKAKYFKNEELHIETTPEYYQKLKSILRGISISPSMKENKIIISTQNAEKTLHRILHHVERSNIKLTNITLTKPSLAKIF